MHIEKKFEVRCPRASAVEVAARDETLLGLFADAQTEIVACEPDRRTTRTHYTALGRSGTATFHFTVLPEGDVECEKECDGNVWREISSSRWPGRCARSSRSADGAGHHV